MKQSEINQSIRALVAKIAKQEGVKVAWSNIEFDDISTPYLQLHIMPAITENLGLALDMPVQKVLFNLMLLKRLVMVIRRLLAWLMPSKSSSKMV